MDLHPAFTDDVARAVDRRRGHPFLPSAAERSLVPEMHETKAEGLDGITLWLHYFVGVCDWWIAEADWSAGRAFGYVCLGDPHLAEWGGIDLLELTTLELQMRLVVGVGIIQAPAPVERDLYWTPRTVDGVMPNRL